MEKLRKKIHQQILNLRAVERILYTIEAEQAEKLGVNLDIDCPDKLKKLIKNALPQELESWPMARLIERAKGLGIYYYSKVSKDVLIREIRNNEQANRTNRANRQVYDPFHQKN